MWAVFYFYVLLLSTRTKLYALDVTDWISHANPIVDTLCRCGEENGDALCISSSIPRSGGPHINNNPQSIYETGVVDFQVNVVSWDEWNCSLHGIVTNHLA